jgi:CRP-like cAMP-binding protein
MVNKLKIKHPKNNKESRCESCIVRHLNSLKDLDNKTLAHIADCKETLTINKGESIFKEGQTLKGLYCVKQGNPKLSKISDNGKDQIIRIASKGELLGHRTLVSGKKTNLSAVALNNMEVCFIPKEQISKLIDDKRFTKSLLLHISNELKESDNRLINMAQQNLKQRLAQLLIYLDNNFGCNKKGFINLHLSRRDISNILGTSKEGCIRMISNFKKEKLIDLQGKKIKIIDFDTLVQIELGFIK